MPRGEGRCSWEMRHMTGRCGGFGAGLPLSGVASPVGWAGFWPGCGFRKMGWFDQQPVVNERKVLRRQAEALESALKQVKERLAELEKED